MSKRGLLPWLGLVVIAVVAWLSLDPPGRPGASRGEPMTRPGSAPAAGAPDKMRSLELQVGLLQAQVTSLQAQLGKGAAPVPAAPPAPPAADPAAEAAQWHKVMEQTEADFRAEPRNPTWSHKHHRGLPVRGPGE